MALTLMPNPGRKVIFTQSDKVFSLRTNFLPDIFRLAVLLLLSRVIFRSSFNSSFFLSREFSGPEIYVSILLSEIVKGIITPPSSIFAFSF